MTGEVSSRITDRMKSTKVQTLGARTNAGHCGASVSHGTCGYCEVAEEQRYVDEKQKCHLGIISNAHL